MKVHNQAIEAYSQSSVSRVADAKGATPVAKQKESSASSTEAAYLSISQEARELAASSQSTENSKVAELRQKIEAGTFKIDSDLVAQRLLDHLA